MNFYYSLSLALCLLTISIRPELVQAQETQNTPVSMDAQSPQLSAPGTSDSGDLENRLQFRVGKTLAEHSSSPSEEGNTGKLGLPGGYNWVILMQVARYSDSNQRLTNTRRGVQRFLESLAESRRAWPAGQVQDTVSILPYHFSLLGQARGRVQPLHNFLNDTSKLKEAVPGLPQDDEYQGRKWRDGHDWRAAMQQTLEWMKASDVDTQRTIFIVLDWNDLAQSPLTLADGTKPKVPATDKDLVLPNNTTRYKAYSDAMRSAGLDPKKSLETVQVGNLEYDLAVFAAEGLSAFPVRTTSEATPIPSEPATPMNGTSGSGTGSSAGIVLIPLLLALAGIAFYLTRPVSFRLDEQDSRQVSAFPAKGLPILGKNTEAKGDHFRVPSVNLDTDRPLATIQTDFSKKIIITNGALTVQNSDGFDQTPAGLRLRGQNGEFDLLDSTTGRVITTISIRRL